MVGSHRSQSSVKGKAPASRLAVGYRRVPLLRTGPSIRHGHPQHPVLHGHVGPGFGFAVTTCCGPTPQPNDWLADGHVFVAERRLLHLARRCHAIGAVPTGCLADVETLCARLPQLVPDQPPVLLHRDLWHGNVPPAADGRLHRIAPACWFGWAECDLAMTRLFGGFPQRFYDAYVEARPPPAGWEERCGLHNLYHLLNHALLFGGGYGGQAATTARRWAQG